MGDKSRSLKPHTTLGGGVVWIEWPGEWLRFTELRTDLQFKGRCEAVHKNYSVSGRPAGWLKKVRLETFFFIFANIFLSLKLDNIFMVSHIYL